MDDLDRDQSDLDDLDDLDDMDDLDRDLSDLSDQDDLDHYLSDELSSTKSYLLATHRVHFPAQPVGDSTVKSNLDKPCTGHRGQVSSALPPPGTPVFIFIARRVG